MNINNVLPFFSTAVMVVFTIAVFRRWLYRRKPHFLFWAIGLAMFGAGSFAEAYFAAIGWNAPLFFAWYLFGAALNAGWLGHGTLLLLARKRWTSVLTITLIVGSLIVGVLMFQTMARIDVTQFSMDVSISEQYQEIMPDPREGGIVRLTTPLFNIYGLITLVGGALWSSWLFLKKQVLPNRVIGNVLIAAGALAIASASTLTRLGFGEYLYVGELASAIMMYAGFLISSSPAAVTETSATSAPSG